MDEAGNRFNPNKLLIDLTRLSTETTTGREGVPSGPHREQHTCRRAPKVWWSTPSTSGQSMKQSGWKHAAPVYTRGTGLAI